MTNLFAPDLEDGLELVKASPLDHGTLDMIVRRPSVGGREIVVVRGMRGLDRSSLARNTNTVPIEIDPLDGFVTLHDRPLGVAPVTEVPLSRRYLLR